MRSGPVMMSLRGLLTRSSLTVVQLKCKIWPCQSVQVWSFLRSRWLGGRRLSIDTIVMLGYFPSSLLRWLRWLHPRADSDLGAAWSRRKPSACRKMLEWWRAERRERGWQLSSWHWEWEDHGYIIIVKGVRKPTHWFSIQTLDLASGLLHWVDCMRDEMVWDPRSDSSFFIKSKIFNWGIVLFLRVYKTLTHRYHIVTVTQNQQVAPPPPSSLLPPPTQEMISDTRLGSLLTSVLFKWETFPHSSPRLHNAHEFRRKLSHFHSPANLLLSRPVDCTVVAGSLLNCC